MSDNATNLPILTLRNAVLFPGAVMPVVIGRGQSIKLLESLGVQKNATVGVVAQRDKDVNNPASSDLYEVGCTGTLIKVIKNGDTYHVVLRGESRFKVESYTQEQPFFTADVEFLDMSDSLTYERATALTDALRMSAQDLIRLVPDMPLSESDVQQDFESPSHLVFMLLSHLNIPVREKAEILASSTEEELLITTHQIMLERLEELRLTDRINSEVKGELTKSQREYVLRKQLKAIKKELGEIDGGDEIDDLEVRLDECNLPKEAAKVASKELKRIRSIQPSSPEYTVARTYLDILAELPWNKNTEDNLDLNHAQTVLDADHHGLEDVKDRLVEFLAVSKLKKDMRGPILCLSGPPGVGKTSLAKSVADALGRKFQRVSLGGVRDEAEIRGHRRTYIGSMPGKIISAIKKSGTSNPLILLDEIDKMTRDYRGDPTAAMLEVLDPAQNHTFTDHYLDVPFDLSKVLFLATANDLSVIPAPLLDRMEVLELSGYTQNEKLKIARKHLLPKQVKSHGLVEEQIEVKDEILKTIISSHTREAGVRSLERRVADVCRKVAVGVVKGTFDSCDVDEEFLEVVLGTPRYVPESAERTKRPGVATGMAWTRSGGDLLFIETAKLPGKGKLRLTGKLGDVMKESAQIALSLVEANAPSLGIDASVFTTNDLHIHFPAGAVPKDGPSAGVTMYTALISLLTDRKVRGDVAMTGEASLRGLVLPVGGIKSKVLAAAQGGIKKVLLPAKNRRDLKDIPQEAQDALEIVFVDTIEEALEHALEPAKKG